MSLRGAIYHNPHLAADVDSAGLRWVRLGENVGQGVDVDQVHAAFLASPAHRQNMLYPAYDAIGVGVFPGTGRESGEIFVVHVFAQLRGAYTRSPSDRSPTRVVPGRPLRAAPLSRPPATTTPNALEGGIVDESVKIGALTALQAWPADHSRLS